MISGWVMESFGIYIEFVIFFCWHLRRVGGAWCWGVGSGLPDLGCEDGSSIEGD